MSDFQGERGEQSQDLNYSLKKQSTSSFHFIECVCRGHLARIIIPDGTLPWVSFFFILEGVVLLLDGGRERGGSEECWA